MPSGSLYCLHFVMDACGCPDEGCGVATPQLIQQFKTDPGSIPRHNGGGNIALADGHVKWYRCTPPYNSDALGVTTSYWGAK